MKYYQETERKKHTIATYFDKNNMSSIAVAFCFYIRTKFIHLCDKIYGDVQTMLLEVDIHKDDFYQQATYTKWFCFISR